MTHEQQQPDHRAVVETGSREEPTEAEAGDIHVAWNAFQLWTGGRDTQLFRRSYLGHFESRDEFGQRLLRDFGADRRLCQLPDWLQAIVRLDGAGFASSFEQAGAFRIYDAPNGGGSYIFDAYCLPQTGLAEDGCIPATNGA